MPHAADTDGRIDAPYPRANPRFAAWFAWYTRRLFRKYFSAVRVLRNHEPPANPNGPLVVCLNHPSWWDPLLGVVAADHWYKRRGHAAPIDEAALEQYGLFKRLGFFGVTPGHPRGGVQFLRTAARALEHDDMTLWVTGEGAFTDAQTRPVTLMPGLAHLAARMPRGTILPLAIEYPFWDEKLPEALLAFGPPIDAATIQAPSVDAWHTALTDAMTATMDDLRYASRSRDPNAFATIVQGRTGVGGVYDLLRGTRARLRGERFDPSHAAATRKPPPPPSP